MFTCREVTEICCNDKPLSVWGRIKLRLHLLICHACHNYLKQIRLIKIAMKRKSEQTALDESERIKKLESKIIVKIKKGD